MNLLDIHEPGQTPLPHEDNRAVGIDLGTTHTLIAIATDDNAQIIKNAHGQSLIPSVVYYAPDGSVTVGEGAQQKLSEGKTGAIASIKRLMGRAASEIDQLQGSNRYEVQSGDDGMVRLKIPATNGTCSITPVEISAEILRAAKNQAQTALGKTVDRAVITVPAYFDDAARSATKDAAQLAGLEVLRLVNEPTAAALAYGLEKGAEGVYAIFDLGGGTFDISLLKLEKEIFQVLATGGNTQLGGDDFDHAIAEWLLKKMDIAHGSLSAQEVGMLLTSAREAKHNLSEKSETQLTYRDKAHTLARPEFNALIQPLLAKAMQVCKQALDDAALQNTDIKGVVMVGGSTRVPLVIDTVKTFFGTTPLSDTNPDEVVALGAARQAHGLTQGSNNLLLDVTPLSLGLETMGGLMEKLIYRNTPIPATTTQEFTTYKDGQTGMQIHILQGEREMVQHNRSLAKFELSGIPPLPAGIARIAVSFVVDADGLLTVSAKEQTTGAQQTVHVKPSYGLPLEEMEAMLRASMQHARTDITERLLVESRVEAERIIIEIESALKFDSQLLTEAQVRQLNQQIQTLRNVIAGDDRDYIDAEVQQLSHLAQPFAQKRMDSAINDALKGAHIDEMEKKNHA